MKRVKIMVVLVLIVLFTTSCDDLAFWFQEFIPTETELPTESITPTTIPERTSTPDVTNEPSPSAGTTPGDDKSSYWFSFTKKELLPSLDDTLDLLDFTKISTTERFLESGTFSDIGAYNCYSYTLGDFTYLYLSVDPDTGTVMQIELTQMIAYSTEATREVYTCVYAFLAGFIEYEDYGAAVVNALDITDVTKSKATYAKGKFGDFWYNNDTSRASLIIRKVGSQ